MLHYLEIESLKIFVLGCFITYFLRKLINPEKPKCSEIKNLKFKITKNII